MIDHQFYPNIYGEIQMGRPIVAAINCPAVNRWRRVPFERHDFPRNNLTFRLTAPQNVKFFEKKLNIRSTEN